MAVQQEPADKNIATIMSLADLRLDLEGHSPNLATLPSELNSLFEDAQKITCLLQSSVDYLTAHPEDPIAWELRYLLVEKLKIDLEKELHFVGELAEKNAKNSLMWQHRRCIAKKLGTSAACKELELTKKILSKDAENNHAWDHRQWIFLEFDGKWNRELSFCTDILFEDIFNSFAWNQRWFVVSITREKMEEATYVHLKFSEATHAFRAIEITPENESAWTHLRRLYDEDLVDLFNSDSFFIILLRRFLKGQANIQKDCKALDPRCYMNKRGCRNALDLISEALDCGCEPFGCREVIEDAFPGWLSNYRAYKGNFDAYWNGAMQKGK